MNDTTQLVVLGFLLLIGYRAVFRWLDVRRSAPMAHAPEPTHTSTLPEASTPAA